MGIQVKTFVKRSGNFRQLAEGLKRQTLLGMVEVAVNASPVDTAAYVDSFGFNGPQGFNSKDRQRKRPGPSTDVNAAKQRNLARLQSEVNGLDMSGPVVFGNAAPHAGIVEDGTSRQAGYKVFAITRREFQRLAREALQKTKSGAP